MLVVAIRQAEVAIEEDRLDDAFAIARTREIREHARGQKLISRLVDCLLDRGYQHFFENRLDEAQRDCERAHELGGDQVEIGRLRACLREERDERIELANQRKRELDDARQRLRSGDFTQLDQICQVLPANEQANLRSEMEQKRHRWKLSLEQAAREVKDERFEDAAATLVRAAEIRKNASELFELFEMVKSGLTHRFRKLIDAGRLDQAELALSRLNELCVRIDPIPHSAEYHELNQVMTTLRQANEQLRARRFDSLAQLTRTLRRQLPNASWLPELCDRSQKISDEIRSLTDNPLVLIASSTSDSEKSRTQQPAKSNSEKSVPMKLKLQVDGAGTFLLLRDHVVNIAPNHRECDLGIVASADMSRFKITRSEDDYFFTSDLPVTVNNRTTNSKLLVNGDRIRLNARCSIRFNTPFPASTSAVLECSGFGIASGDMRRVILFDNALVISAGSDAHIRSRIIESAYVVFVRNGDLFAKPMEHSERSLVAIPMNQAVSLDNVKVVAETWSGTTTG